MENSITSVCCMACCYEPIDTSELWYPQNPIPKVPSPKSRFKMLEELKHIPIIEMNSKEKSIDFRADIAYIEGKIRYLQEEFKTCISLHVPKIRNKIVLNIGCEAGLLAMMMIKYGHAARVIAYDNSNIIQLTQQVIKDNKMNDRITVIRGDLNKLELPHGITEVDVIISNWTQTSSIFHRSIVPWVLTARRRWLKVDGGLIIPDKADYYLNVAEHFDEVVRNKGNGRSKFSLEWWRNTLPYNYNMSSMIPEVIKQPVFRYHHTTHVLSKPVLIHTLDMYTADPKNLGYETEFKFRVKRNAYWRSFYTYSVVNMPKTGTISTEPSDNQMSYQYMFALPECETLVQGEEIYGTFKMENPVINDGICMKVEYKITWNVDGEHIMKFNQTQKFVRA